MASGEDETVAIQPLWGGWIIAQAAMAEEYGPYFSATERQAEVA